MPPLPARAAKLRAPQLLAAPGGLKPHRPPLSASLRRRCGHDRKDVAPASDDRPPYGRVAADHAQLTTVIELTVTKVAAVRAQLMRLQHGTLTFLPFFVKAATEALAYHPKITRPHQRQGGHVLRLRARGHRR